MQNLCQQDIIRD